MTVDYLLAALRSILADLTETCYEAEGMEYDDSYPCAACRTRELIKDLEKYGLVAA